MAPKHNKLHALAVPLPFQGHINPLLGLSKKLVSAGFMVTFANTHINHERITSHTDETTTSEDHEGGDLQFVSLGEDLLMEREYSVFETLIEIVLKPVMKSAVERLLVQLNKKGPPVCLLVFDFRLLCVLDIAIAAGIPSLSLWTQNAANFVCNLLVARGVVEPPTDDSTLFTCAPNFPPLQRKDITCILMNDLPPPFPSYEYGWLPFRRVDEPTWVIINTFEDLEATTLDTIEETLGFRPLALGPLVTAPSFTIFKGVKAKGSHPHLEWLQGHPKDSVLYIAFGTLVDFSEVQLEELVLGLEASKQPFIWVFRSNFCVESKKYTLASLSKTLGSQGLVVPWAPQRDVLSHPSVGGFLTHCGWNSTIEAISVGIPLLAWPVNYDQFLTKRWVVEKWGNGLGFDAIDGNSGLITRMEVEIKIKTLMKDRKGKEMREQAKSLSSLAQRAYKEGGSSCIHFDHLKHKLWTFQSKRLLEIGPHDLGM